MGCEGHNLELPLFMNISAPFGSDIIFGIFIKREFIYKSGCIGHFGKKENELPRKESLEKSQGETKYSEDEWTRGLESAMFSWCFDHPLGIVTVHEGGLSSVPIKLSQ